MNKHLRLPLPWQEKQWKHLYTAHQTSRLPHALLLVGQAGLGKALLATYFSKTLLCKQSMHRGLPCHDCRDCLLVTAGTHPDLTHLASEESSQGINIEQVRRIIKQLNQTTQAPYKIIVINTADNLLPAASHALLKSLEEPTDRSLFILIAESPQQLLPTIRSRCQIIRFSHPERSVGQAWLRQQLPHFNDSDNLYQIAGAAPLQALDYAKNGYYLFYKDLLISLAHLVKQEIDPIQLAESYLKIECSKLLNALMKIVSELIKYQFSRGYSFTDEQATLHFLAQSIKPTFLFQYFDQLIALQRQMAKTTLNTQLILEGLFSRWTLPSKEDKTC